MAWDQPGRILGSGLALEGGLDQVTALGGDRHQRAQPCGRGLELNKVRMVPISLAAIGLSGKNCNPCWQNTTSTQASGSSSAVAGHVIICREGPSSGKPRDT